jgi:hypothetical protein
MSRYRIITIDQLMLFVLALALSLLASTVFAGAREIRGFYADRIQPRSVGRLLRAGARLQDESTSA